MQLDEDQERTVYSASLRVGELVERIKALLGDAGHDIEQYGHALGSFNDSLGRHGRPENLRALVAELVLETGRMAERNKALEVQLSHASDEMTNLRQNLVSVRKEALTDPLTKIANRKCFDDTLREAASHSLGAGEPLSLLMLDIDHFKIFNDRFGHQVGDEVLRVVARTLVRSVKDRIFRLAMAARSLRSSCRAPTSRTPRPLRARFAPRSRRSTSSGRSPARTSKS